MSFKSKNGVTLIALVVTVIVLLILAGVTITAALGDHDKDIISKTYSSKELAETAQDLEDAELDSLYGYGIIKPDDEVLAEDTTTDVTEPEEDTSTDVTEPEEDTTTDVTEPEEDTLTNVIPTGGVYYVGVTTKTLGQYTGATNVYNAGDSFPSEVNTGDVYVFGDYEYRYNYYYFNSTNGTIASEWRIVGNTEYVAAKHTASDGWGVRVLKNQNSYGEILSYINNKPIKNLVETFSQTVVKVSPTIPSTVVCMYDTFYRCNYLTTAATIPSGVTSLNGAFCDCPLLTGNVIVNSSYLISNSQSIYDGAGSCFGLTESDIVLSGSCSSSIKERLAATAGNGNVTIATN